MKCRQLCFQQPLVLLKCMQAQICIRLITHIMMSQWLGKKKSSPPCYSHWTNKALHFPEKNKLANWSCSHRPLLRGDKPTLDPKWRKHSLWLSRAENPFEGDTLLSNHFAPFKYSPRTWYVTQYVHSGDKNVIFTSEQIP